MPHLPSTASTGSLVKDSVRSLSSPVPDLIIKTAKTKVSGDTHLVSNTFVAEAGEHVDRDDIDALQPEQDPRQGRVQPSAVHQQGADLPTGLVEAWLDLLFEAFDQRGVDHDGVAHCEVS